MLELLNEIEHVGELTRILSTFKGGVRLHRREVVALVANTASLTYRYPKPDASIALAISLGLIQSHKDRLSLTAAGTKYLALGDEFRVDVSPRQADLLLALFLDDLEIRNAVEAVIQHFYGTPAGLKAKLSELRSDSRLMQASRLLQQLGIAVYRTDELFLDDHSEPLLSDFVINSASLSEEELWSRLNAQRERARLIEEMVLAWERNRLVNLGETSLAEAVSRVSAANATAGYDIESFNGDGTSRFIEVKSSTGSGLRFCWSANERATALRLSKSYWIYFVPFAHLAESGLTVNMFNDPITLIQSHVWVEKPISFEVTEHLNRIHHRSSKQRKTFRIGSTPRSRKR